MAAPMLDKTGANVDWNDIAGMDWFDEFVVDDPDTGEPFDLTGCTVVAKISTLPRSTGEIKATFTTAIVDATGGVFSLLINRTITATVGAGQFYWACAILDAANLRVRWMYGKFTSVDGVAL